MSDQRWDYRNDQAMSVSEAVAAIDASPMPESAKEVFRAVLAVAGARGRQVYSMSGVGDASNDVEWSTVTVNTRA